MTAPAATRWRRRASLRLVLALGLLASLAGCRLRTEINVSVDDDGSGTLEVAVALDPAAAEQGAAYLDELTFGDLTEAGWVVTGPAIEDDGDTWLRARHDFGTPEEVTVLVDEIAGDDGPFRDFAVTRDDAFAETRWGFTGTVDFTGGAAALTTDDEVAEALDGDPAELVSEALGQAFDEILEVQVAVRLPGDVESNATTRAANGAVWRPSVTGRDVLQLQATSTVTRTSRYVWLGAGIIAGFALVLFLAVRFALWRRSRTATGAHEDT